MLFALITVWSFVVSPTWSTHQTLESNLAATELALANATHDLKTLQQRALTVTLKSTPKNCEALFSQFPLYIRGIQSGKSHSLHLTTSLSTFMDFYQALAEQFPDQARFDFKALRDANTAMDWHITLKFKNLPPLNTEAPERTVGYITQDGKRMRLIYLPDGKIHRQLL